jgi:hypothetical protein
MSTSRIDRKCCAFAVTVTALVSLAACGGGGGGGGGNAPPPAPPLPAGTIAFSAGNYSTAQSTGLMTVTVERANGTRDGSVEYRTSDNSAVAGTDYTARSGTLTWASGDGSAKTISLPISTTPALTVNKSFNITLSSPSNGIALGTPEAATVVISAAPATGPRAVSVRGNRLVDAAGNVLQLRGVSFSGFEFVAIAGFSPADPSGGQAGQPGGPKWSAVKSWKANTVRLTLNEASWLGLTCVDTDGVTRNADPGGNYRTAIQTQVDQAVAAGLYVIISLHWGAPGNQCPMVQTQMANADHSLAFWTSVANTFKSNSSVMFALYNEPFFFGLSSPTDEWKALMNGATISYFPATSGTHNYKNINGNWTSVGMQAMLDAIRATGATNVVFIGGTEFGNNMSKWLENIPSDPLNQIAAEWHPYPPMQRAQSLSVASGGSGYIVGEVIVLAKPNTVYDPARVEVTSVGASGAVTGATLIHEGRYLQTALPSGPVAQGSTSRVGTGATFNLGGWGNLSSTWSMPANWPVVQALSARVPVVLSELGEHNAPGTSGAPFLQTLLPFAGANNFSVIGCCWNLFAEQDNVLIKNVDGTPTDGYGKVFYDWMTGVAWQ